MIAYYMELQGSRIYGPANLFCTQIMPRVKLCMPLPLTFTSLLLFFLLAGCAIGEGLESGAFRPEANSDEDRLMATDARRIPA